jgi:hypothetical protein
VREQFLVELTGEPDVIGRHDLSDLPELNRLFAAWVETVYHRAAHSETGQAPLARWCAGDPIPLPAPETLTEAFLWEEHRRVTKTATVSLHGNSYEVGPVLVGRKVELVFDPFDLTRIVVRLAGVPMGLAIPHRIRRHSHSKAKPETPTAPTKPSGIDYAQLIEPRMRPSWPAASTTPPSPRLARRSPDSSTCSATRRPNPDDGQFELVLRLFPDAVRPRPGAGHAAPPQRAQRSGRPHRLVDRRTAHRGDHP